MMDLIAVTVLGWPLWVWLTFVSIIIGLLAFDLGVLNRKDREVSMRQSALTSIFYIGIGLAFSGVIYLTYLSMAPMGAFDSQLALENANERASAAAQLYLTGFVVEKTLALDNIFVISVIFSYFAVPRLYQHRVLFWGILGVLILRALMIGIGAALIAQFSWLVYALALFLIWTGIAMVLKEETTDLSKNRLLQWLKKRLRVTEIIEGNQFFARKPDPRTGKPVLWVTPLFLALIIVELADILFAVDSIPAIFAITSDPFIVYTSNIFAVLGLRALYFALAAMITRFIYLRYALAATLVFIGAKVFAGDFFPNGKFPVEWSLSITILLIGSGIVFSLLKTQQQSKEKLSP